MGLRLLLPLLLLLASLWAGEWPELSCSARDPREGLWLGVCRRVPWGSRPGFPPPTNKGRLPQCWVPNPSPSCLPQAWRGDHTGQRASPTPSHVPLQVRVPSGLGSPSVSLLVASESLPPSSRSLGTKKFRASP